MPVGKIPKYITDTIESIDGFNVQGFSKINVNGRSIIVDQIEIEPVTFQFFLSLIFKVITHPITQQVDQITIKSTATKLVSFIKKISEVKKCRFFLATGKNNEEQIILNEILNSKFRNKCVALDDLSIKEILPVIKNCNLSVCNDSSFSHLSAALGIKTITLMADTPIIYGNYNTKMFPVIPDGEETVTHNTLGKNRINPNKIFNKLISLID